MSNEYAYLINTLWFSMFYLIVLPVGILISIGGIILYYCINKVNLMINNKDGKEINSI